MKELINIFDEFENRHTFLEIFQDFLYVSAVALSKLDLINNKNRETEYLKIMRKYSKNDTNLMTKLFSNLVIKLEEKPCDILGELYMALKIGNDKTGQFFTPYHLSELTAAVTFDDLRIKKEILEKGYITLNEPTCGSGGMIIAFAEYMKNRGYNPSKQLRVICQDLDVRCVYMTYIQLSLLGIQAKVLHCNTLNLNIFNRWITPVYMLESFGLVKA